MIPTQRLACAVAAAVTGTLAAVATATAATLFTVEAENMTTSTGRVRTDATASGGRAVLLATNGSLSSSVNLTTPASGITVTAKGDQCQGAPTVTLRIDGVNAKTIQVPATAWTTYSVATAVSAGQHTVALVYANDRSTTHCNRNLYADKLTFTGDPPPAPGYSVKHLWNNSDTASAFNFTADSPKIDVFIAHAAESWAQADSFHAHHPAGRAYFYADFGVAGDACCVASVLDTTTVEANRWWATHNGARIPNPGVATAGSWIWAGRAWPRPTFPRSRPSGEPTIGKGSWLTM